MLPLSSIVKSSSKNFKLKYAFYFNKKKSQEKVNFILNLCPNV